MTAPYIIALRAVPWASTILAPKAVLLAHEGQVRRSTTHADFAFRGEDLSALLRNHQDEDYLVVTSDNEVLGTEINRVTEAVQATMITTGIFTAMVYTGSDTTRHLVLSPAGRIAVTITPMPAPKAGSTAS
jgi:hypothetical protein